MKKAQVVSSIKTVANLLHEDWRRTHQAQRGNTPRWKSTIDSDWADANRSAAICREVADGFEVDINSPFEGLPLDSKDENAAAARAVVLAILSAQAQGVESDQHSAIDLLADAVHKAWILRREEDEVIEATEKGLSLEEIKANSWWRKSGLGASFAELPQVEKDKDINHVLIARRVLGEI